MVLSAWSADQTTVDINETRSKKFKAENAAAFFGFSFYLAAGKIRRLFWWLTLYRMVKQFMKNTYSDLLFWLKVALKEKWQGKLQKDILFIFFTRATKHLLTRLKRPGRFEEFTFGVQRSASLPTRSCSITLFPFPNLKKSLKGSGISW